MQERIVNCLLNFKGFFCLLIDEADNIKPNAMNSSPFWGKLSKKN